MNFHPLKVNKITRETPDTVTLEFEIPASLRELFTYKHSGFWHPMDTLRDRTYLDQLWADDRAPWKVW